MGGLLQRQRLVAPVGLVPVLVVAAVVVAELEVAEAERLTL